MRAFFSKEELALIEESLAYTRKAFEDYPYYPGVEFKQNKIKSVDELLGKVRQAKREAKR